MDKQGFKGSSTYVLDEELAKIVNISMTLEMPLLLKGEPGTGKTMLAHAVSETLGMELIVLNVKSLVVKNHTDSTKVIRVEKTTAGDITGHDIVADAEQEGRAETHARHQHGEEPEALLARAPGADW